MTCADVLRPSLKRQALLYDAIGVLGGSLSIGLSAQVVIPLPFSPVPITGQTLATLLVGMLLGSRRGALCLFLYLAEGLVGLPVFSGGSAGPAHLVGPTGGYLVGLVAAAYITGLLAERGAGRRVGTTLLAMLLGDAVIYVFGLPWLALFVGSERVLASGLWPFIPGDLLKLAIAATLLPPGWRLLRRR
jgi:biotin transport system substrate-specific component